MSMKKKKELELYVHIPFCVRKCAYCDFLSGPASEETKQAYVEALLQEIESHETAYQGYEVSSIFLGGGTPSLLTPKQSCDILRGLKKHFHVRKDAEITMEVNPGTVTEEKAKAWKQAGINRISIGLQSVNDEELKMLGRIHTYDAFSRTYEMLRKNGFENLNVDLISAIPGQTVESWRKTLQTIAELQPEHIAAYSLIVEEGTPFFEKLEEGKNNDLPSLPDEDAERTIYEETEQLLRTYGYERYEISNYARQGYACKHNEGYWRRIEYLGIGLGASSLIQQKRFHNATDLNAYLQAIRDVSEYREDVEELTQKDEMEEFMFLGLRMMEGVSKKDFFHYFQVEMDQVYGDVLQKLEDMQLLKIEGNQVRLTKRGIDISNYVFEQFLL